MKMLIMFMDGGKHLSPILRVKISNLNAISLIYIFIGNYAYLDFEKSYHPD